MKQWSKTYCFHLIITFSSKDVYQNFKSMWAKHDYLKWKLCKILERTKLESKKSKYLDDTFRMWKQFLFCLRTLLWPKDEVIKTGWSRKKINAWYHKKRERFLLKQKVPDKRLLSIISHEYMLQKHVHFLKDFLCLSNNPKIFKLDWTRVYAGNSNTFQFHNSTTNGTVTHCCGYWNWWCKR